MFTILYLIFAFAVLAVLDISGKKRIGLKYLLALSLLSVLMSLVFREYVPIFSGVGIYEVVASIAITALLPRIGSGDKIFLASAFLLYPFWLIWAIVAFAMLLTVPFFRLAHIFKKKGKVSLPFYPFLFFSAIIVYIIFETVNYLFAVL
ncbi:MAG: hypothetical protein LVQ97_04990 [Candidatus Micrarchaeales archaeon]|jgi:hypothetical protein|uniref:Peptidase A24A prepilin type IV n=1 Tax=Candidatus Micrarchaeum acidiphilum ARMAN-2 TaxID=425595 RepID=C7DGT6_MICA2|nr:MAG: hypothetical protein UNLARM2_0286 [Candidatus Micrarchaeum acidiphilum ARMAN-2]MCW6161515.1 hypothetical protein [Candidatus Micrarchaeales archaeon]